MKRFMLFICVCVLFLPLVACGGDDQSQNNNPTPSPKCQPTYVYDQVTNEGEALDVLDFESAFNGTSNTADFTLSATHSSTVTISSSVSDIQKFHAEVKGEAAALILVNPIIPVKVGVQAQAIYEGVHQINNSVSKSQTTTTGSQFRLTVPAMSTGFGVYGVYVQITTGHLYSQNCPDNLNDLGKVSTITPEHFGWCTWIRGPVHFADGGQGPCVIVEYNL